MNGFEEAVLVRYSAPQNQVLRSAFQNFYRLSSSPLVEKDIFVEKGSYQTFLRSKLKQRTPFEAVKTFADYAFDEKALPFRLLYSTCRFKFPSGRVLSLTEYLDKPDGVTKEVVLENEKGVKLNFSSYSHAEAEVVAQFIDEMGPNTVLGSKKD